MPEARVPRAMLDSFVVDCSKKREQVEFINSQRTSGGERAGARVLVYLTPWQIITSPGPRTNQIEVGYGQQDWMLNQILWELGQCPE